MLRLTLVQYTCHLLLAPQLTGVAKVAKSSGASVGRTPCPSSPASSPHSSGSGASSPASTPHSSKLAATATSVVLSASRDALIAAYDADADGKCLAAALFTTLLQTGVSGDLRLHRILIDPKFGDSGHIDMAVTKTGKVLSGGISTCIFMNPSLADLAHDYMGKLAKVSTGTKCFTFPASTALAAGFKVMLDEVLVQSDSDEVIILNVLLVPQLHTHKDDVIDMLTRISTASSDAILCSYSAAAEHAGDVESDISPPASPLRWESRAATAFTPDTANGIQQMSLSASVTSSAAKLQIAEDDCVVIMTDGDNKLSVIPHPQPLPSTKFLCQSS
jgi:hypothetical protein